MKSNKKAHSNEAQLTQLEQLHLNTEDAPRIYFKTLGVDVFYITHFEALLRTVTHINIFFRKYPEQMQVAVSTLLGSMDKWLSCAEGLMKHRNKTSDSSEDHLELYRRTVRARLLHRWLRNGAKGLGELALDYEMLDHSSLYYASVNLGLLPREKSEFDSNWEDNVHHSGLRKYFKEKEGYEVYKPLLNSHLTLRNFHAYLDVFGTIDVPPLDELLQAIERCTEHTANKSSSTKKVSDTATKSGRGLTNVVNNDQSKTLKILPRHVETIFNIFKDYFEPEQHKDLLTLLTTGKVVRHKLAFNGKGNQIAYPFRQFIEAKIISGFTYTDAANWIASTFTYQNKTGQQVDFKLETVMDYIVDNKECKDPILTIENVDRHIVIEPATRNKRKYQKLGR